jgi:hypothetical protein
MNRTDSSQKLFNAPALLLIAAVLIAFLVLLFPWKDADYLGQQESGALKEQFSNRLQAELHQMLNKPDAPANDVLTLAQSLSRKGLWESSEQLLSQKIDTNALSDLQQKQLATIQLRNYLDAYYTASAGGTDIKEQRIDVRRHLQFLEDYQDLAPNELKALAKASTDFGLLPQAVKIYYRLAEIDPERQAEWLAEAGRWAGHAGDPVSAAKAFKAASDAATDKGRFNVYIYAWLSAAAKAGQQDEVKAFLTQSQHQLPESPKNLQKLAEASLQAGLPESASDLFAHLAKRDTPENAQRWYEKAAHWAAETKSYRNASYYLQQAEQRATNENDRWLIHQRQIEVYVKDKHPDKALVIITPMIQQHPDSLELLKKGTEIALLEKNLPLARDWNQSYLKQKPDEIDAIIAQVDIETLDEDYPQAIDYVKRAIKIKPKDLKLRERWAFLEETQGNEALAMRLWQWIYQQSGDPKHQNQVVRLAQADLDGEGLAFLVKLSRQQALPKQAVNDIFFFLSKKGDKQAAEKFLSAYLKLHGPDRELSETLAKWYGGEKRYAAALKIWQQLTQQYGDRTVYSLTRFELHWALDQKDSAYRLWRQHKQAWQTSASLPQLGIMAEVAWTYKHDQDALGYYQQLLSKQDKRDVKERILYHTRIALLFDRLGQHPQAVAAFKRGFMETADTDLLLSGLQASFDMKDGRGFTALLALAKEQSTRFAKEPRYWLLQAAYANQQQDYNTAASFYQRVLALDANSKDALAGLEAIRTVMADARKQSTLKQLAAMQTAFDKKDYALLEKLLDASHVKLNEFAELPQYWLLSSQFNYQQKHYASALKGYQRLLALKPDSVPARQGTILILTEQKNYPLLRQTLAKWQSFAERNDVLWPNYALAYQAMGEDTKSLKWFEMASIKHPENYAMLLSYAQSLDKLKQTTKAKQVRDFAITQLRQQLASGTLKPDERKEALFQYLSVLQKDGSQAEFNKTYAELDRLTRSKADKDRMNEIALAQALDKNNLTQLKQLLARADVQRMTKPVWMRLSIALKLKDKPALLALLKQPQLLSTSDHVSVLIALDKKQQAFDVAKQAIGTAKTQEERETARKIALSLANGRVSEFVAAYNSRSVGSLRTTEEVLQYKQGLGKNGLPIGFDIKLKKAHLSNNNLPGSAVNEKDVSVGFEWTDTTNQLNARLGVYDNGDDTKAYGNVAYRKQLNDRLNAGLEYGYQETPDENSYLRQYGRRNRIKVDFNGQIGDKQTAQLTAWQHEFNRTSDGQSLADGVGVRAAVVHRQNTLNGQWYGGVQGTLQKNNNSSFISTEDALPESTQSVELIAGFNHGTPGQGLDKKSEFQYSGSVALGQVWPTGETKAHAEAAIGKTLIGNDELSLGVFYDKGSLGNGEDKGINLQYRKFLDFPVTD